MILLLRISLLACVVNSLRPPCSHRLALTRVASSSTDIVAKAMGPNADRAIQLLRDAADDLEPREAYVFEPEGPVEGVAHFIGGAALGTFPQVAYKALLTRVAQRCGVAVVATPFDLTLDHDAAARTCRVAFRAEAARWRGLPRYGIGHSLGAKLLLLIACDDADAYQKLVLLAPNNSGVADSARLLERLVDAAGGGAGEKRPADGIDWGGVLGAAFSMAGLEVTPPPAETLERVARLRRPARGVTFVRFEDDDDLDAAATLGPVMSGASIDWLDGGHLAPVFVEAGGLRLGEEALVDGVADAICRALDSSAVGLLE